RRMRRGEPGNVRGVLELQARSAGVEAPVMPVGAADRPARCGSTIHLMCGRYSLSTDTRKIAKHFDLATVAPLFAQYNIAPTEAVAAVRSINGERRLDLLHWGL